MKLGKLGVWASTDSKTAAETGSFAQRIEQWGYAALWNGEGLGRNVLAQSSWLLANTTTLIVASGVANIYARDATAMMAAQHGLCEQSSGRFLLGIGVSHAPLVTGVRGHTYRRPLAAMRDYLTAMRSADYAAPKPPEKPLTLIAALGPKMIELAAELADGTHPFNGTPEHTALSRNILGPGKLLCVEQKVILDSNPQRARTTARKILAPYLGLQNYRASWTRLGFDESDCSGSGSDRLIDGLFAWGDDRAVKDRIRQHWDAGANHVCIQAVDGSGVSVDERTLEALAPASWTSEK